MSHSDFTEDDTFDRLRRIPLDELEDRYEWLCLCVQGNLWRLNAEIAAVESIERDRKLYKILSLGFYNHPVPGISTLRKLEDSVEKELCGLNWGSTGWTYESYVEVVQKRIDLIVERDYIKKTKGNRAAIASCGVSGLIMGALILFFHPGWILAVTGVLVFGIAGRNIGHRINKWIQNPNK